MPKVYKTALGVPLDMMSLAAKNEKVRAVSNKSLNARGDTIDSHGRVIQSVNEKVNQNYTKTVGNRSAQIKRPVTETAKPKPTVDIDLNELTAFEKEIEEQQNDDIEVEKIKSMENKKDQKK